MDVSTKFSRNRDVACRFIESEVLAVNPRDSLIYCFNGVASRVWQLLDGCHSVEEIIAAVDAEFEGDKSALGDDIISFIEELLTKNLIA
jgi:hypothetical protein